MKRRRKKNGSVGLFPTGLSLMNLACSNNPRGAFKPGTLVNIVGDSSAGKTLLALSIMAEMCQKKEFDDYTLIYDDVENRLFFNLAGMFGEKLASRIEGPTGDVTEPSSATAEEFYYRLDSLFDSGKKFIYILDSMDALTTESSQEKFQENKEAFLKKKKAKGSYGDGKAKINSQNLRDITAKLKKTKSLLVVISQTRDNIGISFATKTRAGGRALEFYATHIMWLAVKSKIKKTIRKKVRTIGALVRARITKNSLTGLQTDIEFPVYYRYGTDDITSVLDFLESEKALEKKGTNIVWNGETYSRTQLEDHLEEHRDELTEKVNEIWNEILVAMKPKRGKKYE